MDPVVELRSFNRYYTNLIGVVDRHILDSPYSLTEARVLYEIFHDTEATARKITSFLQVDEGYMSRTLSGLIRRGLVERRPLDKRTWRLALTERGQSEFLALDERSSGSIAALLAPLPPPRRDEAAAAARELRRLLGGATEPAVRHDLRPGDLGEMIRRHATLYAAENGFGLEFEGYVAQGAAEFAGRYDPKLDRVWIVDDGRMAGFLLVMHREPGTAQLRYFFLLPEYRGQGWGKRLLESALTFAREAGYERMYLWTTEEQTAALSLYTRHGFLLTEEKPSTAFGKPVTERRYDLDLLPPGRRPAGG
jgi:ribosomal protein S18 acetylase RimI-like enzyme